MGGVLLLAAAAAGADRAPEPRGHDVERFDPDEIERAALTGRPAEIRFFGRVHRLLLEPSPVRSRRFRAAATARDAPRAIFPAAARTFRGHVEGEPGSVVRLSVTAHGIRGFLKTARGWTFIAPLVPGGAALQAEAGARRHKVFTDGDLDPGYFALCPEPAVLAEEPAVPSGERAEATVALPAAGMRTLELAADADFEFFSVYGASAAAEIDSIINLVDGIYEVELGISIDLVHTHIWQAEPDPYGATDASSLLSEFRNHWNANHSAIARDAAHLFTGKNLDGSTIGLAYLGTVCNQNSSYALSQDVSSDVIMPLIVAHEIGHNLGAGHDAASMTIRYIMYPSIGSTTLDEFSAGSKTAIANHVSGVSCLPVGGGAPPPPPPPPPTGGGGGGGGPVDPVLLSAAAILLLAARRRASRGGCDGR